MGKTNILMLGEIGESNEKKEVQPPCETDEEFRDRYRQEIKEAFEEAEKLYPAFGEGRTSRISLLQRVKIIHGC